MRHFNRKYKEFLSDEKNSILIDVRTKEEYNDFHLPKSINIPLDEIENANLDINKKIYLYCRSGHRSEEATILLKEKKYNCLNMGGLLECDFTDIDL